MGNLSMPSGSTESPIGMDMGAGSRTWSDMTTGSGSMSAVGSCSVSVGIWIAGSCSGTDNDSRLKLLGGHWGQLRYLIRLSFGSRSAVGFGSLAGIGTGSLFGAGVMRCVEELGRSSEAGGITGGSTMTGWWTWAGEVTAEHIAWVLYHMRWYSSRWQHLD